MTIRIDPHDFLSFARQPAPAYAGAFDQAQAVLDRYRVTDSVLRLAHFTAQILHETGGLHLAVENLNYRAQRLPQVWPHYFGPGGAYDANDYAMAPEKLANTVYANRMGNTAPGDGFAYRGRGLLQLTGRDSYQLATKALAGGEAGAPDLVASPDSALAREWTLAIAAATWKSKGCNDFADANDIARVTRAINGGAIGLRERTAWFRLVYRKFWTLGRQRR
jgi:putative chitinase